MILKNIFLFQLFYQDQFYIKEVPIENNITTGKITISPNEDIYDLLIILL